MDLQNLFLLCYTINRKKSKMKFQHLEDINQSYSAHFKDAFKYSWMSFKCSIYFFVHACYPDIFKSNGSKTVSELYNKIQSKFNNINNTNSS